MIHSSRPPALLAATCLLAALATTFRAAAAQWRASGAPLSTRPFYQQDFGDVAPDGAGGVITTWIDGMLTLEGGLVGDDVYVGRIDATGVAVWGVGGVGLCTASGDQAPGAIASDDAGGAIVAWFDERGGALSPDVYAGRVDPAGEPLWTTNGVPVCTAGGGQFPRAMLADGAGGAFIVWWDLRSDGTGDLYAQRINAGGQTQWLPPNGVPVAVASGAQDLPDMVSDGTGGFIVTWQDYRAGGQSDIYAQRMNDQGQVQWATNGVAVCVTPESQDSPQCIADGAGGVFVTWTDYRGASIYAQRLDAGGQAQWTANGVPVCTAAGGQNSPQVVSDGAGGMIIGWVDGRDDPDDIYAQRLDAAGVPLWQPQGVPVCTTGNLQVELALVADDAGGAIATWSDVSHGSTTYAQRIDGFGTRLWPPSGVALISGVTNRNGAGGITSDGAGGAIQIVNDENAPEADVFAQRVLWNGITGDVLSRLTARITSITDVPGDQGGRVLVGVAAAPNDSGGGLPSVTRYTVWRRSLSARATPGFPTGAWDSVATVPAGGASYYDVEAPTSADSSAMGPHQDVYVVTVHTATPSLFTTTGADSGHSVDNLAPAPPEGLVGEYVFPTTLELRWMSAPESDWSSYAIYKGTDPDFPTDAAHELAAQVETLLVDPAWATDAHYKVTVVDVHGNESPAALLSPGQITAVAPSQASVPSARVAIGGAQPARGPILVRVDVPTRSRVTLSVVDIGGRMVRLLVDDVVHAGPYRVAWDGRDASGRPLAAGVYVLRAAVGDHVGTNRLVRLR